MKGFSIPKVVSCRVLIVSSQFHLKSAKGIQEEEDESLRVSVCCSCRSHHHHRSRGLYRFTLAIRITFEIEKKGKKRNEKKTAAIQHSTMQARSKTGFSSRLIFVLELRTRRKEEEKKRNKSSRCDIAIYHIVRPSDICCCLLPFACNASNSIATTAAS